jgi:hypothetical protein
VDFQFRNQQVAGSSPAGGSITPFKLVTYSELDKQIDLKANQQIENG